MIFGSGTSRILNNDNDKVTASSTILDKQGIVKYTIHPRMIYPYLEKNLISIINKSKSNQLKLPILNNQEDNSGSIKQDFSITFYWSIPLKSRLFQIPTKSSRMIEHLNPFQKNLMKISIGTQNVNKEDRFL